jgi:hypothetical protein
MIGNLHSPSHAASELNSSILGPLVTPSFGRGGNVKKKRIVRRRATATGSQPVRRSSQSLMGTDACFVDPVLPCKMTPNERREEI